MAVNNPISAKDVQGLVLFAACLFGCRTSRLCLDGPASVLNRSRASSLWLDEPACAVSPEQPARAPKSRVSMSTNLYIPTKKAIH